MKNKKIYAVVGMAGSGKSEVIKFLQNKFGWPKVYFGEPTFDRMKEDGMELNYENERITREKIRKELGMGGYAILCLPKIKKLLESSDIVLVESLYSWDEYKILKNEFNDSFEVIASYASPKIRFDRLKKRIERPINDFETFKTRDWSEIEGTDKGGPIAIADFTLINQTTIKDLYFQINELNLIEKIKNI